MLRWSCSTKAHRLTPTKSILTAALGRYRIGRTILLLIDGDAAAGRALLPMP